MAPQLRRNRKAVHNSQHGPECILANDRDTKLSESEDQLRRWINPRKKAVANFIHVTGDVRLSDLTPDHMLEFRGWWLDRLESEGLTANSANKDFTHLGHTLKTVNTMKELGHSLHLDSLASFSENDPDSRPPFSDEWIKEKLLSPGALDGLNAEARAILVGMINTGYRPSEAVGLTPDRICLNANIPHIKIASEADREIKNKTSKR